MENANTSDDTRQHQEKEAPQDESVAKNGATGQNKSIDNGQQQPKQAEQSFLALAGVAPLFLLLLIAAQSWPDFWQSWQGTSLFCPAEVQHIRIAREVALSPQWFAPMTSLPAQWPGFTWLLMALSQLPNDVLWLLYPLVGACSAFLALFAVWLLSRAAGFGGTASLAAALTLLCTPLFAPLSHFVGPAALATALMLLSQALFCRGWQADGAWLALSGGFLCAGLAGLTGGPFFLAVPLATSVLFLCWRCTISRAHYLDAMFGFLLLLTLVGGWLACVILFTHAERYIQELFGNMLASPAQMSDGWWRIPAVALLGVLPWIAVVFCASWGDVLKNSWANLKASRKERAGSSFVWLGLIAGILLSCLVPAHMLQPVAVAIACLATPLLGRSLTALSVLGRRAFVLLAMLCLLAGGVLLVALYFDAACTWIFEQAGWQDATRWRNMLPDLIVVPLMGAGCMLAAVGMVRFFRAKATMTGFLLYCTLVVTILHQPALLVLSPALGTIPEVQLYKLETTSPATRQETPVAPDSPATIDNSGNVEQPAIPALPETDTEAKPLTPENPATNTPNTMPQPTNPPDAVGTI